MRFAVDTGGTFTDLLVESDDGSLHMFKAPTIPHDPIQGVLNSLEIAAQSLQFGLAELLGEGDLLIHGTTHAINAIITGRTAKTALLTTLGHRDMLVFREGGRIEPFNFDVEFPKPYVPRSLTFEVPERIMADGKIRTQLGERSVLAIIDELKEQRVEAVAVALLWSILNPAHELRIGELLQEHLPGRPYTLSHEVNPAVREYRRASSACIDASLKPLMSSYMRDLAGRLEDAGFHGRILIVTSQGGVIDPAQAAKAPIHLINSGPSLAPIAGAFFAGKEEQAATAIVADTGGTTYDISVVRNGRIPRTRETWIGERLRGFMTGFPSVDVKSIGAGGGSIAWVDSGGLLHVGPRSAGAEPGPACYGKGGQLATVTDAALVLGYLDAESFLDGQLTLQIAPAKAAIRDHVAKPLGLPLEQAAAAVFSVVTENMAQAIIGITVDQGIDPRGAVLVGGGGAAGLNSTVIARRLGCSQVLIPEVGAALSAAGALMSNLTTTYHATHFTTSKRFDFPAVNRILELLALRCREFINQFGAETVRQSTTLSGEARYAHQVWELEVPLNLACGKFESSQDVKRLREAFDTLHAEVFAVADPTSEIEIVGWNARADCVLRQTQELVLTTRPADDQKQPRRRRIYLDDQGWVEAAIHRFEAIPIGAEIVGPAVIESSFTTIVVDPAARAIRRLLGSLAITPSASLGRIAR